jgi:hypothetical protein
MGEILEGNVFSSYHLVQFSFLMLRIYFIAFIYLYNSFLEIIKSMMSINEGLIGFLMMAVLFNKAYIKKIDFILKTLMSFVVIYV